MHTLGARGDHGVHAILLVVKGSRRAHVGAMETVELCALDLTEIPAHVQTMAVSTIH